MPVSISVVNLMKTSTVPSLLRAAAVAVALAGCNESDPGGPNLPDWAVQFRFEPQLIEYYYVDSSSTGFLELTWLRNLQFNGENCLQFAARTPEDTVGSFYFVTRGPNVGWLERTAGTTTDTTTGYLLPSPPLGTRGSYVVMSDGRLQLNWFDGTPSRYFDPQANLRFVGDTLFSDFVFRARADSIYARWRTAWLFDGPAANGC